MCTICHRTLPNVSALEGHLGPCADRARKDRYELAGEPEKVATQGYLNRGIWRGHKCDLDIENGINPQRAGNESPSKRLLDSNTYYPRSPSINRVMNAWTNNPYTTAIMDFEYH
jgi:hypothetical protein